MKIVYTSHRHCFLFSFETTNSMLQSMLYILAIGHASTFGKEMETSSGLEGKYTIYHNTSTRQILYIQSWYLP